MKFTNVNLLLSATAVVTTAPLISAQAPCPAPWVLNSVYDEGDQVTSFDNLNVTNNIYECNAWPFNHLCGQSGFQPGSNDIGPGKPQNDPEPAWKMAWTLVGGCSRTPPDIKPFDPSRRYYEAGEIVTNKGKKWRCRVWPYSWRCHQDGYEPGEDFNGYPLYEEAWEELLPTNAPSIASSNVPSESPSLSPSESPSHVPSEVPSDKPSLSPSDSPSNAASESPSNVPSSSNAPSESPSNVPSSSNVPSVSSSNVPSTSAAPSCQNQLNRGPINICLAIDLSSSICWNNGRFDCDLGSFSQYCCTNFKSEVDFAREAVTALESPSTQYSIAAFNTEISSTYSQLQLSDANTTLSLLDSMEDGRGATNHHLAIDACQSTFANSTGIPNTILLITDGASSDETAAEAAATAAKNAGTTIVPVLITSTLGSQQFIDQAVTLMTTLSSGTVLTANDFTDLPNIVESLATEVFCG